MILASTYEDGTSVVARTQLEMKKVLLQPVSTPDSIVNSIISVPCDGSLNRLLVTVNAQFTHVFVAEYSAERPLTYDIVASSTRHISAGPAADRPTLATTFAASDYRADTDANHTPTAGSKAKKQVRFGLNIATYHEFDPKTAIDIAQAEIAAENQQRLVNILKHILLHILPLEVVKTYNKPSSPNDATENQPFRILKHILHHIPPPKVVDISRKPSSPNDAAENQPIRILNHILQHTPPLKFVDTSRKPSSPNNAVKFLPFRVLKHILHHTPPPKVVETSRKPISPNDAAENQPIRILNHILQYTPPLKFVETSRKISSPF
ncbi:Hypothetical protein CINCED_3A010690 [Cinara cedri]|uniref:Uncharacterized protein n=1 Tax=Cinara cedri TaxID=506608 RepID=A0A5E4N728_9HEMI|nr:Hypothetical protein CINCED_3A010690 [Cinara cedri]